MIRQFPDRTATLFGRDPDLRHLFERGQRSGVTAVVGRAQMGKSWLLTEAARHFTLKPETSPLQGLGLATPTPTLVGFAESVGQEPDLLLRAVTDLYARWLSTADFKEQARVVAAQQGHDVVGTVATVFGSLFKSAGKLIPGPTDALGELVKNTLDGLVSVNSTLNSGGTRLARLNFDLARELLTLLHKVTEAPIVLFLDQWEKSPGIEEETRLLETILGKIYEDQGEWPPCHLFLGVRKEEKSAPILARLTTLEGAYTGAMEMYELLPMHLDPSSSQSLLAYIRKQVPVTQTAPDAALLDMISGYPGIVARWTSRFSVGQLDTPEKLQAMADNANRYLYAEFDDLRSRLDGDAMRLSIRLALLPGSAVGDTWSALETIVMQGVPRSTLDTLYGKGILESTHPPTFGHSKRLEAAVRAFEKDSREQMAEIAEELVVLLSAPIRAVTPQMLPFSYSLAGLDSVARKLELSVLARSACATALSLFQRSPTLGFVLADLFTSASSVPASTVPLLTIGFANALGERGEEWELKRRLFLLSGLREMANGFSDDPQIRMQHSMGIYNTLLFAQRIGDLPLRDELMEDLRTLAHDHAADAEVRRRYIRGLFNTLTAIRAEHNLERRDLLLNEMRGVAKDYSKDLSVIESLARALNSTMNDVRDEGDLPRRDALLEELHDLEVDHPDSPAARLQFSRSLYNSIYFAKEEGALERRDALLVRLRSLAEKYPDDALVRNELAKSLYNTGFDTREEGDTARCVDLLTELQALAAKYPDDATVAAIVAKAQ